MGTRVTARVAEAAQTRAGHRAAHRVVDILELLAASRDGLALHAVSAQLEAPKSSLLSLLRTLTARGLLEHTASGEYRLGPRALALGGGAAAQRELSEVARPALSALMRRTGETVFLGVLGGDGRSVVYVDKVESEQIIRYSAGVGDRRPLHATSTGKTILAFLPEPRREEILKTLPLARHTEQTVTSRAALRQTLAEIRRAGVCVSVDEMVPGAAGVAAPIFDRHGASVGACTVAAPSDRLLPQQAAFAEEVRRTARVISTLLGHRPSEGTRDVRRTP